MDFADRFGWRSIEGLKTGVHEKVAATWTFTEMGNELWVATKNDNVYASAGSVALAANPAATSKHLGGELDLIAEYRQNTHVTHGFGVGRLFPADFCKRLPLAETTPIHGPLTSFDVLEERERARQHFLKLDAAVEKRVLPAIAVVIEIAAVCAPIDVIKRRHGVLAGCP